MSTAEPRRWETMAAIAAARIVAVIRADTPDAAVQIGRALADSGITVVEVSLTTPDGLDAIRTLASDATLVGAGTVLDAATARLAILAGARFVVAPTVSEDVVRTCHRYGVAVVPGAQTPTEVQTALEAGADAVKIFPAEQLGPAWARAVLAALPQAPLIPTGGVSSDTADAWLRAGCVAVGVGGALTSEPAAVAERATALLEAIDRP